MEIVTTIDTIQIFTASLGIPRKLCTILHKAKNDSKSGTLLIDNDLFSFSHV